MWNFVRLCLGGTAIPCSSPCGCWALLSKNSKENRSQELPAAPPTSPALCGEGPAQTDPPWLSTGAAWECGIYSQNSQGFLGGRRWCPYLTEGGRDGSDPALNLKQNNGSRGWGRVRSSFQTQTCQKYRFSALPLGNSFISQFPSPSVHPVPPSLQFPEETQRYRFHPGCMGGL